MLTYGLNIYFKYAVKKKNRFLRFIKVNIFIFVFTICNVKINENIHFFNCSRSSFAKSQI